MTNEQWLREDADFQEHQREHNIAMIPAVEDAGRLRAAADELAAKDRELAELRALVDEALTEFDAAVGEGPQPYRLCRIPHGWATVARALRSSR